MDVSGRIAQANGRLKAYRVGCSIQQMGEKLYLVATLPPRPDSSKTKPFQQRIALGVGAHPRGVQLAEQEARKVGSLLDCGEFDWQPYLKDWGKLPQSVSDWVSRFEAEFKPTVAAITWETDYEQVFNSLDARAALTVECLRDAILKTEANSRSRRRWCLALGRLAKFAGLECDFKPLRGNYSASQVDPRNLPTDEQIADCFYRIKNPGWRWVYGMIATYGLRNHEVFFLNTERLEQGGYLIEVLEGKTDQHMVWACYPEWVDDFGLRTKHLPNVTGKEHADYGARVTHYFADRLQLPFTALDLRHRWAVRTLEFGLPVELAAKQMGHSVDVHTNTYHRWITADVHQRAFEALMMRVDRPKAPVVPLSPLYIVPRGSDRSDGQQEG